MIPLKPYDVTHGMPSVTPSIGTECIGLPLGFGRIYRPDPYNLFRRRGYEAPIPPGGAKPVVTQASRAAEAFHVGRP